MSAAKYYNFMENSLGLGRNGTHLAHAGMAGGVTWAAGQYGGVEIVAANWWAPFAGAFVGLGLSITARFLAVDDNVTVELVQQKLRDDLKSVKLNNAQRQQLRALMVEMTKAETEAISGADANQDAAAAALTGGS